jgi:hypothetical protein
LRSKQQRLGPLVHRRIGAHQQAAFLQVRTQLGPSFELEDLRLLLGDANFSQDAFELPTSSAAATGCCEQKRPISGLTCSRICPRLAASMPSNVVNCSGAV